METTKRNSKDTVFCDLFSIPEYTLQLYQALHPEDDTATVDSIEDTTLRKIITDNIYNDLSFIVGNRLLVMVEAQSKWSVNILIRMLVYYSENIKEYIHDKKLDLYGTTIIPIPIPEFFVIYTGEENIADEYSLADTFFDGTSQAIDIRIKILKGGSGNNIIEQYVRFSKKFTEEYHKTKTGKETIENTVRYCIENGILADYLKTREKEVVSIMMELFDQEYATKAYGNSMKKEGINAEKRSVAFRLFKIGSDYNTIIAATAMPYETIAAWHKEYSEQTNK